MARGLLIAPRIGETAAVLIEVPVLVAASWCVTRQMAVLREFSPGQCAIVGATALALTLASEAALAQVLRAQNLAAWLQSLATPPGLVGLLGQMAFAAMPVMVCVRRSRGGSDVI